MFNVTAWITALLSLGVAIASISLMSLLEHRFGSDRFTRDNGGGGRKLTALGWAEVFGIGFLYGVMFFLNGMAPVWGIDWLAVIPFMLALAAIVYVCARWSRDSARPGILATICSFILAGWACMMVISSAAIMTSAWSAVPQAIVLILVWFTVPAAACWILAEQFYALCDGFDAEVVAANARGDYEEAQENHNRALLCLWAGRTTIFLKVVGVILIIVLTISFVTDLWAGANATAGNGSDTSTATTVATKPATEPATAAPGNQLEQNWLTYQEVTQKYSWLTWNNFALQSDGDPDNNANFGPDRHQKGWTATDYFQDMKSFDETDVMILVAHVAAVSAARDTSMVGDYYDGNNHDWARTMNALIAKCLNDQVDFMHFSEVYLTMLRNEVRSVRVVHMDDINDQMYITPYTYSGVPELVASETHQSGDILVVTFKRKGGEENDVSVGFRIDCCYQPVGVIDTMGLPDTKVEIPPEYTPGGSSSNGGKNSGEQPTTTPTPTPTTTPSGSKNPADDPANNGNADKGGGDNRSSDGSDEYQSEDPRNNGGQAEAVTPQTPAVNSEHSSDDVVDHQNPPNYQPDPVTSRGPVDGKPPTSSNGDGEFVPAD